VSSVAEPWSGLRTDDPNFRDVLDAIPAAVYATDAEGVITYCNKAAAELAGRVPRIGIDKWCVSWRLHTADGAPLPHDQCPMAVTLKTGQPVRGQPLYAERPDGSRVLLMPSPTPLRDAAGRVTGAVNLLVDIDPLRAAQDAAAQRAGEQAVLYSFTDRLYRAETLAEVYEAALDAITPALGDRASILLFDEEGMIDFVAARGLSPEYQAAVRGHTPWREGQRDAEPLVIADIASSAESDELKATVTKEGIRALLFIPLISRDGVIGKFMAYRREPHAFTSGELDLGLTIARQLGFAIEREGDRSSQRKAEQNQRDSEARYRAIVETTPECVKLVARDGTLLQMNSIGLDLIGADCFEAVEGRNIYDVIAPEDRERFVQFNERICDGERGSMEFDIISLNGERRHMETHAAPFKTREGDTAQLAVTRDVSARKHAEQRQRERDAEFRALADNMAQLAWMADPEGKIYWFNRRWFEYTGRSPDGDTKAPAAVHPDFAERVLAKYWAMIGAGEPWEDTFPLRAADGTYRWFLSRAVPIRDEAGNIVRWFGTNTDVTEQRAAQDVRNLLSAIVEGSDDAIASKDLNGVIISWNKGAERLFGYTPEEIIGKPVLTLIPPELQHEEPGIIDRIRNGERIEHYETVRVRKGGERINVSLTVSPIRDSTGRIIGASKIARDITDRKRAEEQRTLLINELNHRVKNTLATVQSLAMQTLRNTTRSEEARELFDSRLSALARAHDLLTAQNWERASLTEVVSRALSPFRTDASRVGFSGPEVSVSPKQALALSIALHELATNAAKYGALSNDAGRIDVTWMLSPTDGDDELHLTWRESGGPTVTPPTRAGFGSRLIQRNLARELGGDAQIEYRPEGVVASISTPLDAVRMIAW
jgi:PAS domain S-box-containing protein